MDVKGKMVNILPNIKEWFLVAGVLCLSWMILRSKKVFHAKMLERRLQGKGSLDPFSMEILEKIFTVFVFFISLMAILQIFGLDIVPLLTFSGIGAAILGFASRDVVANFFGGLMIYMTNPFALGDFIELPGKKISGTVEEIGWYLTTVRDTSKRNTYIPNSLFSTELLLNHSRVTYRRIEEKIRIKTFDRAQEIIDAIRKLLKQHPDIEQSDSIEVFLVYLSPYGMEVEVKACTRTNQYEEFMQIKQDILLQVSKIAYEPIAKYESS